MGHLTKKPQRLPVDQGFFGLLIAERCLSGGAGLSALHFNLDTRPALAAEVILRSALSSCGRSSGRRILRLLLFYHPERSEASCSRFCLVILSEGGPRAFSPARETRAEGSGFFCFFALSS